MTLIPEQRAFQLAVPRGWTQDDVLAVAAAIRNAEEAARAEEREWCAKLCDIEHENPGDDIDSVLTRLAAAIRARSRVAAGGPP